jgi:low density lipoprotein-related protein 2
LARFAREVKRVKKHQVCVHRYLYWADYGQTPKIERSLLDGTNRTTLVRTGIMYPRGLSIDAATGHVFWVDTVVDAIQRISFSGGDRQFVRTNLPNPFGVAVFGDDVYWVDRTLKKVSRRLLWNCCLESHIHAMFDGLS